MNTAIETRRRVLFVDDDPRFLVMIDRVMGAFSAGRWEIATAENASRALALIQEKPPHLVVIDVQMPVVDGLQFLTLLNRRQPNLLKVVLTGFATEAYRAACLSNGAELFLEKPKTPDQQRSLFAALDELMKFQPEDGFRGVLRKVGLPEIIQMTCLGAGSCILEIRAPKTQGRIFIQDGVIVHADVGERQGELAFNYLLTLRGGEFGVRPFSPPPMQTIEGSWEFLLMEAVRQRDEAGATGAGDTDAAVPGAITDEAAAEPTLPAFPPTEVPSPVPVASRTIEEVFLCSAHGDVLYDWQVRNRDLWVNFFEFLSQKARRLALGLPLGHFDRLEIRDGPTRLVIVIDDDRGVLVRSREEPLDAALESSGDPTGA